MSDGFVGIDPQQLDTLITTLTQDVKRAQPVVEGYFDQFNLVSLDTGRLNTLLSDYGWAQSQLPMLQRRYDLANAQPATSFQGSLTTGGADSLGMYTTAAGAKQGGMDQAQAYLDGDASPADMYGALQASQYDPDFLAGVFQTLGASGLQKLEQEAGSAAPGAQESEQSLLNVLVTSINTAMAGGFNFTDSDEQEADDDLDALVPLLKDGEFSPQALADLGKYALTANPPAIGSLPALSNSSTDFSSQVWQALAANPQAAALFIAQNGPGVQKFIAQLSSSPIGSPTLTTNPQISEFFAVVKAGTIDAATADPQLAANAVNSLVAAYSKDPSAVTNAQYDALFGQIIKEYWPDITQTVTNPDVKLPLPDGINLTAQQWRAFTVIAGQDPATKTSIDQLTGSSLALGAWLNPPPVPTETISAPSQADLSNLGKQQAQQFLSGSLSEDDFLSFLKAYQNSPAAITAAMEALGPDGVSEITEYGASTSNDPDGTANMQILATAMATAMNNGMKLWFTPGNDTGHLDLAYLSPLLKYATFPPDVLAALGGEAMGGPGNNEYAPAVWQALGKDPQAAALFIQQNANLIPFWTSSNIGMPSQDESMFLQVLKEGTIGAQKIDPTGAAAAIKALAIAYGPSNPNGTPPAAPPDAFAVLYGQIIKAYWPDVSFSITAPGEGVAPALEGPDGSSLTPQQWANLVDQAMTDPQTAANIMIAAQNEYNEFSALQSKNTAQGAEAGVQAGQIKGFFNVAADTLLQAQGGTGSHWASTLYGLLQGAMDQVEEGAPEVLEDPEDLPAVATIRGGYFLINALIDQLNPDDSSDGPPAPSDPGIAQYFQSWESQNDYLAVLDYENATSGNDPQAAAAYAQLVAAAQKYDGGSFLANLSDPAKMTAAQQAAFNQWLEDPAVSSIVVQQWTDQQSGAGVYNNPGDQTSK